MGTSRFHNLTWLTKSCSMWTLYKRRCRAQCQPNPEWFHNKIFQRLPLTIGFTTALSLEIWTSTISAREATSHMQLTKSHFSVSTPVSPTLPPSNNFLDTSAEPATTGWFWIQTDPSPSNFILMQTYVGTGIVRPWAMTPQPQNHNHGT